MGNPILRSPGVERAVMRIVALACTMLVILVGSARAHDVALTEVAAHFKRGGSYQVDMHYDVNAWLAGVRPEHLTAVDLARVRWMPQDQADARLDELRNMVLRRVRLWFDGKEARLKVEFPEISPAATTQPGHASPITRKIRLTGEVPSGAKSFEFWASRSFGNVALTMQRDGGEPAHQLVERGARSDPFSLIGQETTPSGWHTALQYGKLGFKHILPEGLDHILFVLGLFLLSTHWKPLLWQVSAFTVAHTITLALSTYGVVSLSPRIVEPLIALSIAYVAVENLFTSKMTPWRPVVVFCFGLLHGMGFAGVLGELGLPKNQFATALLSFNVGVELGQVTVIALAFAAVGWWRNRPWYRQRVVVPASVMIAGVGLFWAVQRTIG